MLSQKKKLKRKCSWMEGDKNPSRKYGSWIKGLTKETDERVAKISQKLKGKPKSEEHKIKLSKYFTGRKNPKRSETMRGRKLPKKHKEAIKKGIRKSKKFKEYMKNKKFFGKYNSNWKGGKSYELYPIEFNSWLKKEIRKRDKFVCQICYKNGFIVHHIDYNKRNNNPENLTTLCRSCHAQTNSKREFWEKYFKEVIEIEKLKSYGSPRISSEYLDCSLPKDVTIL